MVKQDNWKTMTSEEKRTLVLSMNDFSAGEMAARINGATRNALIGFCHRQKIPFGAAKGLTRNTHKTSEQMAEERKKRYSAKQARAAAEAQADAQSHEAEPVVAPEYEKKRKRPPPSAPKDATVLESQDFHSNEENKASVATPREGINIMDLTDTTCRWPLNASYLVPVREMMFCGKPTEIMPSYCPQCHLKTLPPQSRRNGENMKPRQKKSLRLVGIR